MVASYELKLFNRFEILATVDQEELENGSERSSFKQEEVKKKMNEAKMGASNPKPNYRRISRQDEVKTETYNSSFDRDINMSISYCSILYHKTKTQILLLEWLMYKNDDFQMACKYPEDDSMSLLEEPSQEDGIQSSQGKEYECPAEHCTKVYRFEKHLRNHVRKHHDSELENTFFPTVASTYKEDFEECLTPKSNARKRKVRDDDDSDGGGEKGKKLSSIREEPDNLGSEDMRLLDDSVEVTNTQDVQEAMKEAIKEAEKAEIEIGTEELDESLRREEAEDRESMARRLKIKDDLLHIRNATVAEQEAELGELKTVQDQLTLAIKRVREKAKKENEEKEKKIEEMAEKLKRMEKRAPSPSKEAMKEDMEKATNKIKNMSGRIVNLTKDLKNANKDRRKAEVDNNSYEKMKTSLEKTALEMEDIKREMEGYKREVAKANKKIPCTKKDCNNPRECEFSHHLRYELRSEPKEAKWEKRVPCRFQAYPGGCFKTAEECKFLHVDGGRKTESSREEEEVREPSVEFVSEAGPSWAVHTREETTRRPPNKKPRVNQGNEGGAGNKPEYSAPRTEYSRRSSVSSSGNAGGPVRRRTEERRSRTPLTPASRGRSRTRSRSRDTRRMGQVPPRHQVQDPTRSRPRSDREQERMRRDYSRPRNQGRR